MRTHRWWSSCGIVFAAMMLASCTQAQIEQVLQNKTQDMISGPCPPGSGPVSAAPEFCLYVTEMHVGNHDTEADVSATIANRTGRRLYLVLSFQNQPYLTDSSGTKWDMIENTGIPARDGVRSLSLEPNVDSQVAFRFRRNGQGSADLTFSMRGEIGILKTDSRGEALPNELPKTARGFNFSGLRQGQQPSTQPAATSGAQGAAQSAPKAFSSTVAAQGSERTAASVPTTSVNVDIVGLRLGMTPEEVRKTIREHDKTFRVNEQRASLQDLPGVTFLSEVTAALDRRLPVGALDSIGVHFPPPPHKSQAIFINRFKGFEEGTLPLVTTIKDGLIKKYGTPSFIEEPGFEIYMEWAYDSSGARISDSFRKQRCIRFNAADPQDMPNVFFEKRQSDGCGITVLASMGRNWVRDEIPPHPGQLVTYLSIYIIDDSKFSAMRTATQSYVDTSVRDSAKNVPAPRF